MKKKNKKQIDLDNNVTSYPEFIPTFDAWMTPDALRDRAREVGEATKKKQ